MITLQQIKNFLNPFKGATASSNGKKGLVPIPKIGDEKKFLQGSGIWEEVDLTPLENDIAEINNIISAIQTNKSNITADNINVANYLTKLGFTGFNKAETGYYKMPNGLILQWGSSSSTTGEGNATITFPITFPTACLTVIIGTYNTNSYPDRMMQLISYNTTTAAVYSNSFNSAGGTQLAKYLAIGY